MKKWFLVFALIFYLLLMPIIIDLIKLAKVNGYTTYLYLGLVVLLLAAVILLVIRIVKMHRENAYTKYFDQDTEIGNLLYFKKNFEQYVVSSDITNYYAAYIIIDSSYLCSYYDNSSFNDVLKYTAYVLSENTAEYEISARIAENGFVFAYKSDNEKSANQRLMQIMNKLNRFERTKEKEDKLVFHCAVYNLTPADTDSELLLFNLRRNCNGILGTENLIKNCDVHSMNEIKEEKELIESIISGLENEEFKMYLQFIVDNKTKKIISAEALSRWDRDGEGIIPPFVYIDKMQSAGLISKHDFYMFELVCRQLEKWNHTEFENVSISCNFTRITLSEDNFTDTLKSIVKKYDFDRSKLAIEITEDVMEENVAVVSKNVQRCKEMGFCMNLDDLGSGYTTFSNLCDYPIDAVKIDRDILLKTETKRGHELFKGIIALAHSLNIRAICEGVETEEQNNMVSSTDCDYIQGWYYSKAMPLCECETFIKNYSN